MHVSLSLWSMDLAHLADDISRYDPLVASFHVDVTDGNFADDLLFGPLAVETVRAYTDRQIVAHLMVTDPDRWIARFVDAGADLLVVHTSADGDFLSTVRAIRDAGVAAGAAIGLDEPSQPVLDALSLLSVVLVMGTAIGVKGHPFDDAALAAVRRFVGRRTLSNGPDVFVDGGIRWSSVPRIAAAGADGVVAGSIITTAEDPPAAVGRLTGLGA
jgi:ribulose-phosphate 3-epimerase